MAFQFSDSVRNARADAFESTVGVSPLLRMYTGSEPANCAAAASGTKVSEMTLPSDWMQSASSGSKAKLGTWQDTNAPATGTAGYFRIYDSTGTTCHAQGTVTVTGGGGDLTIDDVNIVAGNTVTVTGFTLAEANG